VPRIQLTRAVIATPTTQRDAEARDLRIDRAQPDMTQTFLKAIEDRLPVAFEIDDRSDFRSAWARAGANRSGRSRPPQDFPSRPRHDTGDEYGSRRSIDRAVAATGDFKTATGKPRVDFSDPERQRGRHAWVSLCDLADLGVRDITSDGGRADLMETLAWRFRRVLRAVSKVKSRQVRSLRLYLSGAGTGGFA
jgi:hypothetical protein